MKHVDLEKFANGAFSAQVNRAIEEVTENIQNPNTDAVLQERLQSQLHLNRMQSVILLLPVYRRRQHLHRHSELLLLSVWARTCRPAR